MAEGEVCIPNIGARQRKARLRFGVYVMIAGLVLLALLLILDAPLLWRLPLVLLYGTAAAGYFEARDKT